MAFRFNQTPKIAADALAKDKNAKGVGIFLVAAPELGVSEYKAVLVPNIGYVDCAKRARNCTAFKWVPESVRSFEELQNDRDIKTCSGFCLYDDDCVSGCICHIGDFCY